MSNHPLDAPEILQNLFYPRKDTPGKSSVPHTVDSTVPVAEGVEIGYRLYPYATDSPLILYFHGNGEIAGDHDMIALMYAQIAVSLLVVDFRGYGWSTGTPLTSTLLPDSGAVFDALPGILERGDLSTDVPLFVMGRSLGSAPAIYLAHRTPLQFRGLIVESGFADTPSLFRRLGIQVSPELMNDPDLPINNLIKMESIDRPLLVIHGERDQILPVSHGQRLFDASPSANKTLLRVEDAGHNDLLFVARDRYFDALGGFVKTYGS